MARVRSVEGARVTPLSDGWHVATARAGAVSDPAALERDPVDWCPAAAPSTAASALRDAGRWGLDDRVDFDAADWWYRCRFAADRRGPWAARALRFGGLATLAEVWLNGSPILQSDNMFIEHDVDVGSILREQNDLFICFRSVKAALGVRRPRPRWRTRLVEAQQLRWLRTTLLGRAPAWSPPAAPVGPWRPVVLEDRLSLASLHAAVRPRVDGDVGLVSAELTMSAGQVGAPQLIDRVVLRVGEVSTELTCVPAHRGGGIVARGTARVSGVDRWWPHTHGRPARYPVDAIAIVDAKEVRIDLGRVGFRTVEVDGGGEGFALRMNGDKIFCRGACWTGVDSIALTGSEQAYRATLEAARAAGMNMIRVCGPFFYEADAFYELCDELGILVWQDYAFANMDYPSDDPAFIRSVEREARDFLHRTELACSLAVLCGNSEVEQQAAMMGAPRDLWRAPLFGETLAAVSREHRPDVAYRPSTPSGGALPFVVDTGTAHYFGVGAYLRPLEDARRADVRFATECLAFANVPSERVVDEIMKAGGSPPQDPAWKRRVPRDSGAGWDFEDVRDHYLRILYGVDPAALRYADAPRYLALSRVVTGEVMAATFSEWRRAGSRCGGALIWFLRDLWPGAGWGVLDAGGQPKAAYHYVRRVLRPVAVLLVDEGLSGLDAHIVNDSDRPLGAELRVVLLRDGEVTVASARSDVSVARRSVLRVRLADQLSHFFDVTYAYRFGPPSHDIAFALLVDPETGQTLSEAYHFARGLPSRQEADVGLQALATPVDAGIFRLSLTSRRFAQSVALDIPGFEADDDYFHVAPGAPHHVTLRAKTGGPSTMPSGTAQPLNAYGTTKVALASPK